MWSAERPNTVGYWWWRSEPEAEPIIVHLPVSDANGVPCYWSHGVMKHPMPYGEWQPVPGPVE